MNMETTELHAELQRLKRQLEQATAAKDEAERAKNEYMQNVAHQLAAPINAIKMNIETLKNPKVHIDRKQVLLRSIYSQGTILAHLIKNFSLMSHLEAEHHLDSFREKPEEVDLFLLCVNFSNDFQPIGAQKDQTIEVLSEEFDRFRHPKVWVIKNLFSQVVYNLLENATKYGDADSKIAIGLRCDKTWISATITSTGAPAAVGPYSQAILAGNLLFCAGQIPLDPASGELVPGDAAAQTERVCANIRAVLAAAGLDLSHVVKTTVFLTDLADFAAMNAVYSRHFTEPYPARSTIQVAALPKGARVEIEALACRPQ